MTMELVIFRDYKNATEKRVVIQLNHLCFTVQSIYIRRLREKLISSADYYFGIRRILRLVLTY